MLSPLENSEWVSRGWSFHLWVLCMVQQSWRTEALTEKDQTTTSRTDSVPKCWFSLSVRELSPVTQNIAPGQHPHKDCEQGHRRTCTMCNCHIPLHGCRLYQALEKSVQLINTDYPRARQVLSFFYFIFCSVGNWTRAWHITRQVLYHWPTHSAWILSKSHSFCITLNNCSLQTWAES